MKYTPKMVQRHTTAECTIDDAPHISIPSIVRSVPISDFEVNDEKLILHSPCSPKPLAIGKNAMMRFGTENLTALEYFKRVIERNDLVDACIKPGSGDAIPMQAYWIHIKYAGKPPSDLEYSKKDDGLFALRAKAGEKAERFSTKVLRDEYGHKFPDNLCTSPGFFEIRYSDKKSRLPDRTCTACDLTLEVKKRNRDKHFRVSHSELRPFPSENNPDGWHAFVFSDMKPRFVPNSAITKAILSGDYIPGKDRYDAWADVDSLSASDPPKCKGK